MERDIQHCRSRCEPFKLRQSYFLPLPPQSGTSPKVPLAPLYPLHLLLYEVKAHLPTKGLRGHASACEM